MDIGFDEPDRCCCYYKQYGLQNDQGLVISNEIILRLLRGRVFLGNSHGILATSHVSDFQDHLRRTWMALELLHVFAPEQSIKQPLLHPGQLSPAYIANGTSPATSGQE